MHRFPFLAGALLAAPLATAAAQGDDVRALAAPRVAAQFAAGLAAMPVGFVVGGKLTERVAERFGASESRASRIALAGAWTGAAALTAAGPALVGARGPGRGSYPAALGGAVAGGLASLAVVRLNDRTGDEPRPPCRLTCVLTATAVFALPSVGATVGYNLSRKAR